MGAAHEGNEYFKSAEWSGPDATLKIPKKPSLYYRVLECGSIRASSPPHEAFCHPAIYQRA